MTWIRVRSPQTWGVSGLSSLFCRLTQCRTCCMHAYNVRKHSPSRLSPSSSSCHRCHHKSQHHDDHETAIIATVTTTATARTTISSSPNVSEVHTSPRLYIDVSNTKRYLSHTFRVLNSQVRQGWGCQGAFPHMPWLQNTLPAVAMSSSFETRRSLLLTASSCS